MSASTRQFIIIRSSQACIRGTSSYYGVDVEAAVLRHVGSGRTKAPRRAVAKAAAPLDDVVGGTLSAPRRKVNSRDCMYLAAPHIASLNDRPVGLCLAQLTALVAQCESHGCVWRKPVLHKLFRGSMTRLA